MPVFRSLLSFRCPRPEWGGGQRT